MLKTHKNMKVLKKYVLTVVFFLVLSLFVVRVVFATPGVISFNDWSIPPLNGQLLNFFKSNQFIWHDAYGTDITSTNLVHFTSLFYAAGDILGLNGAIQSNVIVIMCLSLSGLAIFALCLSFGRSFWPSLIAGIFYMFTPWIFVRIAVGDIANMTSYFLTPVVLWLYGRSISRQDGKISFKYIFAIPLLLSFTDAKAAVITYALLLIYAFFRVISSDVKKTSLILNVKSMLTIGSLLFAIYSFFVIPVVISSFGGAVTGIPPSIDDLLTRSLNANWPNVIRLSGNSMGLYLAAETRNSFWSFTSYSLAVIVLLAPIFVLLKKEIRQKKEIIFFSFLGAISLLLSLGPNSPIGFLYTWSFLHISFFQAFRDPDKFTIFACFAYAVLLAASLQFFKEELTSRSHHLKFSYAKKIKITYLVSGLIVVLSGSLVIANAQPFLTGNLDGFYHPTVYPTEYQDLYNWLNTQPGDFKTFWVPPGYLINYDFAQYPQHDLMALGSPKPNALGWFEWPDNSYAGRFEDFLFSTLYQPGVSAHFLGKAFGMVNVKYIIFPNDADSWEFYYWSGPSQSGKTLTPHELRDIAWQNIISQQDLKLKKRIGDIAIFENLDYKPAIYGSNAATVIAGGYSTLISLGYLDGLINDNSALFFSSQLDSNTSAAIVNASNSLVVEQGSYMDFVVSQLPSSCVINPSDFAVRTNIEEYWSKLYYYWWGLNWNYLDPTSESAVTSGNSQTNVRNNVFFTNGPVNSESVLDIPLILKSTTQYDIWAKLYFGPKGAPLDFLLDGTIIGSINTTSINDLGYAWVKINSNNLSSGKHAIALVNTQGGEQVVSEIVVSPHEIMKDAYNSAAAMAQNKKISIVIESEKMPLSAITPSSTLLTDNFSQTDNWVKRGGSGNVSSKFSSDGNLAQIVVNGSANSWVDYNKPIEGFYSDDFPLFAITFKGTPNALFRIGFQTDNGTVLYPPSQPGQTPTDWSTININLMNLIGSHTKIDSILLGCETTDKNSAIITYSLMQIARSPSGIVVDSAVNNASQGSFIEMEKTSLHKSASVSDLVYVPVSGFYQIYMRVSGSYSGVLALDNVRFAVSGNFSNFTWVNTNSVYLEEGNHILAFTINNGTMLWDMSVITSNATQTSAANSELIDFSKINPTLYSGALNSTKPVFIILANPYNANWQLTVNGKSTNALPAFSFLNCFLVNDTGNIEFTILFSKQTVYSTGLVISYVTFVSIFVFIIYSVFRRFHKVRVIFVNH
jgi:hypothetical protein